MPSFARSLLAGALLLAGSLALDTRPLGAQVASVPAASARDTAAVLGVVRRFFDVLARGDSMEARSIIARGMSTARLEVGPTPSMGIMSDSALSRLFTRGGGYYLERMWNPTVLVQGPIAVVWTPYDFHRGGAFAHCGIDVFTLMKQGEAWTIVGLAFTIQPVGCAPSPLGPPK